VGRCGLNRRSGGCRSAGPSSGVGSQMTIVAVMVQVWPADAQHAVHRWVGLSRPCWLRPRRRAPRWPCPRTLGGCAQQRPDNSAPDSVSPTVSPTGFEPASRLRKANQCSLIGVVNQRKSRIRRPRCDCQRWSGSAVHGAGVYPLCTREDRLCRCPPSLARRLDPPRLLPADPRITIMDASALTTSTVRSCGYVRPACASPVGDAAAEAEKLWV